MIFSNKLSFELNEWRRAACTDDCLLRNFDFLNLNVHHRYHKNVPLRPSLILSLNRRISIQTAPQRSQEKKRYMHYLLIFLLNSELTDEGTNKISLDFFRESPLRVSMPVLTL